VDIWNAFLLYKLNEQLSIAKLYFRFLGRAGNLAKHAWNKHWKGTSFQNEDLGPPHLISHSTLHVDKTDLA